MKKTAFTMIELVFVIVVMGIIGKFGTEFLAQAYNNFIYSNINNSLQAKSEMAVQSIASRLQYRIKDSTIARQSDSNFTALSGVSSDGYHILEWVGYDIDGFRGTTKPYWSGIIDLKHKDTNSTYLVTPETNTTAINELIQTLSYGDSDINDSALYFIGSNSNIQTGYGWDGDLSDIDTQNGVMHPIRRDSNISVFIPTKSNGVDNNFSGVDVYEFYQLAWSAYAVEIKNGDLTLYYDYQPWKGEKYSDDGKKAIIMQNVSTFEFMSAGSVMKIQVCVKTDLVEDYSLCKEKTIF